MHVCCHQPWPLNQVWVVEMVSPLFCRATTRQSIFVVGYLHFAEWFVGILYVFFSIQICNVNFLYCHCQILVRFILASENEPRSALLFSILWNTLFTMEIIYLLNVWWNSLKWRHLSLNFSLWKNVWSIIVSLSFVSSWVCLYVIYS